MALRWLPKYAFRSCLGPVQRFWTLRWCQSPSGCDLWADWKEPYSCLPAALPFNHYGACSLSRIKQSSAWAPWDHSAENHYTFEIENVQNPQWPGSLKYQVGKLRSLTSRSMFNKYLLAGHSISLAEWLEGVWIKSQGSILLKGSYDAGRGLRALSHNRRKCRAGDLVLRAEGHH